MVERIIAQRKTGEPDRLLSNWLATIPDDLRARLEKAGLIEAQKRVTLQNAVDAYIDFKKAGWDKLTYENRMTENSWFFRYFKPGTLLEQIDRHAAVKFMNWLQSQKELNSPAYINKILKWATSVYRYAILCGDFTSSNPFTGVRLPEKVLRDIHYITVEYTDKLIEKCPSVQWRTVVSMLRFGGMRPEEILLAEWSGVDWEAGTFTFISPKTERHPGKDRRTVPLFPRLRQALEEMRMAAEIESGLILPRYIISSEKPRNGWDTKRQAIENGKRMTLCQLSKYIKKAKLHNPGAVPTNMRGSCSSDLKRKYPEYAVDHWLGHTKEIARKHYDVVTADLFEQAAREDAYGVDNGVDNRSQNRQTRDGAVSSGIEQDFPQVLKNAEILRDTKKPREISQGENLPPRGFEPL